MVNSKLGGCVSKLNNIVVFIKDEAMLEESRRILVENGEKISPYGFHLSQSKDANYLFKGVYNPTWKMSFKSTSYTEITLTELETLLKEK